MIAMVQTGVSVSGSQVRSSGVLCCATADSAITLLLLNSEVGRYLQVFGFEFWPFR